ncbi:hypothetical protein ABLN72_01890 [Mycobacterium tuberculosis]
MTLIQTVMTDVNLVIQVADRRNRRDWTGSKVWMTTTPNWCAGTCLTVGSAGLARIEPAQKKSTSEGRRDLAHHARSEDRSRRLRYSSGQIGQLPTGKGWWTNGSIIIAGFDRRRIPLVAEIEPIREAPRSRPTKIGSVLLNPPSAGHSASFHHGELR